MAEEKENQAGGQGSSSKAGDKTNQSGDPGRTPGSAEGERETVEEDLRDQEGEEQQ